MRIFNLRFSSGRYKNHADKEHRQNVSHIISAEVRSIMDFNYEEIGTFDAEKAAKALIELAQKIKQIEKKVSKKEDEKAS